MKCRFKTNKILTAVTETKHTITTSERKVIHKKTSVKTDKISVVKETGREEKINQLLHKMWKIQPRELLRHTQERIRGHKRH